MKESDDMQQQEVYVRRRRFGSNNDSEYLLLPWHHRESMRVVCQDLVERIGIRRLQIILSSHHGLDEWWYDASGRIDISGLPRPHGISGSLLPHPPVPTVTTWMLTACARSSRANDESAANLLGWVQQLSSQLQQWSTRRRRSN
jgi:hypothetical protein